MKIKYISENDLETIKGNMMHVFKKTMQAKIPVSEALGIPDIIKQSQYSVNDFSLDMSAPKGQEPKTDVENVKRVYGNMMALSDSMASDERIWAAYTFSEFLDYMMYRWPAMTPSDLENRYVFGYGTQRSLFRNGLSRLWWIGRFTYDESRDDPYELTTFLCAKQDCIETICGRSIFNNPDVGRTTLDVLMQAQKKGIDLNRDLIRNVGKYVNFLAGTYILESMDSEKLSEKIVQKFNF